MVKKNLDHTVSAKLLYLVLSRGYYRPAVITAGGGAGKKEKEQAGTHDCLSVSLVLMR